MTVVEVQRIWRVAGDADSSLQVRLLRANTGAPTVVLEDGGLEPGPEKHLDVDVARALAQAMLEACEVATALAHQVRTP